MRRVEQTEWLLVAQKAARWAVCWVGYWDDSLVVKLDYSKVDRKATN